MTLTSEDLKYSRQDWQRIDFTNHHGDRDIADAMKRVLREVTKLGLDPEQDATYDLLEDGLTTIEYDRRLALAEIRQTLAQYHAVVAPPHPSDVEYWNANMRRVHGLEYFMKRHESTLRGYDLPEELSKIERRELDLLRSAYADGTLQKEIKQMAARAALDQFETAIRYRRWVLQELPPDSKNFFPISQGSEYAQSALNMIEKAGEYHTPGRVTVKIGGVAGRAESTEEAEFSVYNLNMLKQFFLLEELKMKFRIAMEFQEQGVFVVDQSGSGHGAMVMPVQDILHSLQRNGLQLNEPATYAAIGTDIESFRNAYLRERAGAEQANQFAHLIKPEISM